MTMYARTIRRQIHRADMFLDSVPESEPISSSEVPQNRLIKHSAAAPGQMTLRYRIREWTGSDIRLTGGENGHLPSPVNPAVWCAGERERDCREQAGPVRDKKRTVAGGAGKAARAASCGGRRAAACGGRGAAACEKTGGYLRRKTASSSQTTGAQTSSESMRSRMPPWPGSRDPMSLMFRSRLIMDSARSPRTAAAVAAAPVMTPCHQCRAAG